VSPASGLLFAVVLAAAVATPGPSTLAVAAQVFARGLRGAGRLCIGLVLGELFWLLGALFGVAALARLHADAFEAIRHAGVAYLLWLAWKFWRVPPVAAARGDRDGTRLLFAGAAVALGNPKTMLFYIALLPAFVDLEALPLHDALILAVIACAIVAAVLAAYALSSERLRRRHSSPVALRRLSRGSALLMAVVAGMTVVH
jgi:threonine/homoserine/homoserine lactone efflux protein